MRKLSEFEETQLSIANCEYEEEKKKAIKAGRAHSITVSKIERKNNLRNQKLSNWRVRFKKKNGHENTGHGLS